VTGLARAEDEDFVRGLGADFTTRADPGWDAVADGAVMQERGLALVRDGGTFVGVQPQAGPAVERGISVEAVATQPDGRRQGRDTRSLRAQALRPSAASRQSVSTA
jgi:hypothetical protein